MRQSKLFGKTTKTIPSDIKLTSHRLLYQAGFIRESSAGRYYFLPLGLKVRDKIMKIIEEEMNKAGAQKLITPVLHPLELWEETNRTSSAGFELMQVEDRHGAKFALGGTAEEMMVDLIRKFNLSYKDLPLNIYQFSQKFRDELRARGGLLRVREFMMKDAYSFHVDEDDFKKEYQKISNTYTEIFKTLGLKTVKVEADNGYIGGDYCHEFMVESQAGEDELFKVLNNNNIIYNKEIAPSKAPQFKQNEQKMPMKEIKGEGLIGVEELCKFLDIPIEKTTKTILFENEKGELIAAAVRGDYEINEIKLRKISDSNQLTLASEDAVKKITGAEIGYAGILNLPDEVKIYMDESLQGRINFETGANKTNYHTINVNFGRDLPEPKQFFDIKIVKENDLHPPTNKKYEIIKGIEVGNIFQLGFHYSEKMKATFTDKDGKDKFYYMGCYGIGVGRTLATIVEKYNDNKGIVWPENIAPFKYHLINLSKNTKIKNQAELIYKKLLNRGDEVLFDDREESSPGEKLKDADLIGIPYRLIISDKTNNKIELKKRNKQETKLINIDEL